MINGLINVYKEPGYTSHDVVARLRGILKQKKIGMMREDFVHTMIHELRRPVQALKMCISFLNDPEMRTDEETCREVTHDAIFELDNLSAYLGKLKDMFGMQNAYWLCVPCFIYILYYGISGYKIRTK